MRGRLFYKQPNWSVERPCHTCVRRVCCNEKYQEPASGEELQSHNHPPTSWPDPTLLIQRSALNGIGPCIPRHCALPKIRLVCHMTSQGSVVSKHCILHHGLARTHCLKEVPQMRFHIVPGDASVSDSFEGGFLPRNG